MKAGIFDMPTGPSSSTPTQSAYDVESPVSSGESEAHMGPLSPSPPEGWIMVNVLRQRLRSVAAKPEAGITNSYKLYCGGIGGTLAFEPPLKSDSFVTNSQKEYGYPVGDEFSFV
ncbi:hypothetical protein PoB_003658300 [Plakobranchus ocellatus]|uniref:Uncharacterized protein n=1 Tax=Plakobranchus ocellatus TaxID=259542 RepID=A0AAV4AU41_9GAST|nr:hypothetical protein PoB_003658300 [Plakobranchus ocellatus]